MSLKFGAGQGTDTIVSSNTAADFLQGISINDIVGANRFYNEGYDGSRAVVTIAEGGHMWNGHDVLGHVTEFFDGRQSYSNSGINAGQLGDVNRHAVWVGHTAGGRETVTGREYQKGIAPGAALWSSAIATTWNGSPYTGSWSWSRGFAFTDAYALPMLTGANGRTTDVINSSWGFSSTTNSQIQGGNWIFSVTLDGIVQQSRATSVFAAGNEGPNSNTIRAPGNGYNSIVVGALGSDTSNPAYSTISNFSSRGPQRYVGPDGDFGNVRARVDITAPGQNMSLAFYGGTTGGNTGGTDSSNGATDWYTRNAQGTSFAAPVVSGGAGLLVDVAYDRFSNNIANARDGQVIKAVLLNSAAKPSGWDNGQTALGGFVSTTQALDYTYGAGMLDLNQAFEQYTSGTTDLAGNDGGTVQEIGWDFGVIDENASSEYFFDQRLVEGTTFTATLNWFVGRTWEGTASNGGITSTDDYFTDLSLELWTVDNSQLDSLVARSDAGFINTEHFSLELDETDFYALRVFWDGERYDFVNNSLQTYGLAWSATAVPEPGLTALAFLMLSIGCCQRRRK
ncbi:MAG: S8 family serine peptidase [Planctomycetota bacterium]